MIAYHREQPLGRVSNRCLVHPFVDTDAGPHARCSNHHAAIRFYIDALRDHSDGAPHFDAFGIIEVVMQRAGRTPGHQCLRQLAMLGLQSLQCREPVNAVALWGVGLQHKNLVRRAGWQTDAAQVAPLVVAEIRAELYRIVGHAPVLVAWSVLGREPRVLLAVLRYARREHLPLVFFQVAQRGLQTLRQRSGLGVRACHRP